MIKTMGTTFCVYNCLVLFYSNSLTTISPSSNAQSTDDNAIV